MSQTATPLRHWRRKDVFRFRNADLIAIRYETGCRDVFDYHEAICDLIEQERANLVKVSLFTLARGIHDDPSGEYEEWAKARIAIMNGMRDRGLVEFEGDVHPHRELEISLPEDVYLRWHTDNGQKSAVAKGRPRGPGGKFRTTKKPQEQGLQPQASTTPLDIRRQTSDSDVDNSSSAIQYDASAGDIDQDGNVSDLDEHWSYTVADTLTSLNPDGHEGIRNQLRDDITLHFFRNRHIPIEPEAYQRAAEAFEAKVAGGWKPERSPVAYLLSTVKSHRNNLRVAGPVPSQEAESYVRPHAC